MPLLSVVIPSRNEQYLNQTIKDILQKSKGKIEVISVLEGYWPEIIEDKRVHYIHFSEPRGMRGAINAGVALASGEYIMKTDAHCMFNDGFDTKILENIEKNWIVIPRRYALDVSTWEIEKRTDNKYPIDEMVLNENLQGIPTERRFTETITDLETFQGSCWVMNKDYFHKLKLLDDKTYGSFWQEAQEICGKCRKDGGRVVCNISTWYAHWHKTEGRGYSLSDDKQITRQAIRELYESN